ncbi:MAG: APC family permease [Anaerolineae bacterium]|nr:MAG: APC family permease [Anaerolineae bacterium]
MLNKLRFFLLGSPLRTQDAHESRLDKIRALAAFSPDALSSIAYANQEIYLGLVVAGSAGLVLAWPIGLAIALLLVIVSISYYQTIQGYPSGGGSYMVARENLGIKPGLVAGAALLIDYILTAAVSLTAGVDAIISAFPSLLPYRVTISLAILGIITILNLRGLRETGVVMAVPVYLFLFTYLGMLGYGLVRALIDGPGDFIAAPSPVEPLTILLILHAFSSGCTALTGIEAISNSVPSFKTPQEKNAQTTLIAMALLMGILFVGSIGLTQYFAITTTGHETILSGLARHLLGTGPLYYLIQISTTLILAVAANTSFTGFPRVAAILAKDSYLPRQLTNVGDRLVFGNGILLLSVGAGALIVLFQGDTHTLVPLFAIGVFLAFTLSQAGMVIHWWRVRADERNWRLKAAFNGIGALATAITLVVVGVSKFSQGAWITIFLIPSIVVLFTRIQNHYKEVAAQLTLRGLPPSLHALPEQRLVVPISGIHRGSLDAVRFALSLSTKVTVVYVEMTPGSSEEISKKMSEWFPDLTLEILPSPYRSIVAPLVSYIRKHDEDHDDGQQAVLVLPEFVPTRWWQGLMHNQTAWLLKAALLYRRPAHGKRRVIIDVAYHLDD